MIEPEDWKVPVNPFLPGTTNYRGWEAAVAAVREANVRQPRVERVTLEVTRPANVVSGLPPEWNWQSFVNHALGFEPGTITVRVVEP